MLQINRLNENKEAVFPNYFHSTISVYCYEGLENVFDNEVVIKYCQYFKSNKLNDLDNRNFK